MKKLLITLCLALSSFNLGLAQEQEFKEIIHYKIGGSGENAGKLRLIEKIEKGAKTSYKISENDERIAYYTPAGNVDEIDKLNELLDSVSFEISIPKSINENFTLNIVKAPNSNCRMRKYALYPSSFFPLCSVGFRYSKGGSFTRSMPPTCYKSPEVEVELEEFKDIALIDATSTFFRAMRHHLKDREALSGEFRIHLSNFFLDIKGEHTIYIPTKIEKDKLDHFIEEGVLLKDMLGEEKQILETELNKKEER